MPDMTKFSDFIEQAQKAFTASSDPTELRIACDKMRKILAEWNALDSAVRRTVRGLYATMQAACTHPDAQRGYNERDGDWMNRCPICGATK